MEIAFRINIMIRKQKLEWICENKQRWEAIPNSIQQRTWGPFCPKYKREKLCREI